MPGRIICGIIAEMTIRTAVILIILMVAATVFVRLRCSEKTSRRVMLVLLVLFIGALVWVTLLSRQPFDEARISLSFRAFKRFLKIDFAPDGGIAGIRIGRLYRDTYLNILMFVPLGYLLPMAWRRARWWKMLLIGLGSSLLIEALQLVTRLGWFDIDDILANTIGAMAGFILFVIVNWIIGLIKPQKKKKRRRQSKQRS